MNENKPEFYNIIPEFNSDGRLCNYHQGEGETVKVMESEWIRFNQLAGRQHEIVDGIVIFNSDLEPCMPDDLIYLQLKEVEQRLLEILNEEKINEVCGTVAQSDTFRISEKDMLIEERNRLKKLIK